MTADLTHVTRTGLTHVLRSGCAVRAPAGDGASLCVHCRALSPVAIAFFGIFLAWLMYYRKSLAPERFSEILAGVPHRVIFTKYYVDEIYQATVIRGTLALAGILAAFDRIVVDGIVNGAAWVVRQASVVEGAFDKYIVDGAVNGVGAVSLWIGERARSLQTGHIYSYLYVVVIGVVAVMFMRLI